MVDMTNTSILENEEIIPLDEDDVVNVSRKLESEPLVIDHVIFHIVIDHL
jgi:hypothetical protein